LSLGHASVRIYADVLGVGQSRHAAIAELQGDFQTALMGYDSAVWMLQALLDDVVDREEDRGSIEKGVLGS
jgi:hypothetical protein